ncbi:MAG TPA: hypothetical protein PLM07_18855, partial [Candidatus Rifleibacterium sp.]|nr:hypothetical protein [Candidatus Rifleibacterium sp.]
KPGEFTDTCINNLLDASWNRDLEAFAREVDKDASIRVDVWLRDFESSETDPAVWDDPVARNGFLVIESTGGYKSSQRKIAIRRRVKVCSTAPGVLSKFTMYVSDAARRSPDGFNLIRNDYRGMITDGPRPLILYNHPTPDSPIEPGNIADVARDEKQADVWKHRGWLWLGGRGIRLNLCSGAGDLGEIFHFYDVSNPNVFSPVKFTTPADSLPVAFSGPLQLPWDKSNESIRQVSYTFGHSFILDGFHDRSSRKESEAMYEGNILSTGEKNHYSSKSSILHLFGDARRGYQSRTRVFGVVSAAFIRFANLEVKPEESDAAALFAAANPPPLYLLRSVSGDDYDTSVDIEEVGRRSVGGPLLKAGMLFKSYDEYAQLMSRVVEMPYSETYNSMQDVCDAKTGRTFPSSTVAMKADSDEVTLQRDQHIFFKGRPSADSVIQLLEGRVQFEVETINDFWDRYLNQQGELELNAVVRIKNPRGLDMQMPAVGRPQPMMVRGGGIIILEAGNLVLRGISCSAADQALTVVVRGGGSVSFASTQPNQVNLIAPEAELAYGSKFDMLGTLCVGSLYADHRFQGGVVRFRTGQDPILPGYDRFYKVFVDPKDSYWNE